MRWPTKHLEDALSDSRATRTFGGVAAKRGKTKAMAEDATNETVRPFDRLKAQVRARVERQA